MSDQIRADLDELRNLSARIRSHADDHDARTRPALDRAQGARDRTRGRGAMAESIGGAVDGVLGAVRAAERQLHQHLRRVADGVDEMGENHRRNDKTLEGMLKRIVDRSDAQVEKRGRQGVGISRPDPTKEPTTVTLKWKPGLDETQFEEKSDALKRLGDAGELFKLDGKVDRDSNITADYKGALVRIITGKDSGIDPDLAGPARDLAKSMQPDHVAELQTGGRDSWENLRMLDSDVNFDIGTQQIRPQISKLSPGTPLQIETDWISHDRDRSRH
ncbi:hypothetical protein ACYSUO_19060 [Streptomyces sp. UC4497]